MTEPCPVCGRDPDNIVPIGVTVATPGRIDEWWDVCPTEDGLYVHNEGLGTYVGESGEK